MSLIICPECKGKVSDKANTCPHCGYPINKNVQKQYNIKFVKASSKVKAISKISQITNMSIECTKKLVDNNKIIISNIDMDNAKTIKNILLKDNIEVEIEENDNFASENDHNTLIDINIPKCPTCGSTNIRRISGSKKAASIIGFGILSNNLGKTYECLNCKYKW